jgi:hypothetical protein
MEKSFRLKPLRQKRCLKATEMIDTSAGSGHRLRRGQEMLPFAARGRKIIDYTYA